MDKIKRTDAMIYGMNAERLFINCCSSRYIPIFKNCDPRGEIDYVVYVNNSPIKVQVKSSVEPAKKQYYTIGTRRSNDRCYSNIDYFVIYLHSHNRWYIIPEKTISGKKGVTINLDNDKYKDFIDNWSFNVEKKPEEIEDHNVEKRNIAIDQFKSGKSKAEIARMLKIHYGTINVWLREAGYGIRKLSESKEKLSELYNSGKTMKEIAIGLDMSIWTIRNLFRKYNITVRVNRNPNGRQSISNNNN